MKKEMVLVLNNIRSAHNVGSIFRSADGAGFSTLYLCGYTPRPLDKFGRLSKPQKEISKTALGAEQIISYKESDNFANTISELKKDGYTVLFLEQAEDSIKLLSRSSGDEEKLKKILNSEESGTRKIALCLGEEVNGFSEEELSLADHIVEIPMAGQKESLNVSVAAGVAMFELRRICL